MTGSALIINANAAEVRVALIEDHLPVECYIERCVNPGVVGNIYRGQVVRVLRGMQAAFVEIGLGRTGFLYVDDAVIDNQAMHPLDGPEPQIEPQTTDDPIKKRSAFRHRPIADIANVLREGEEIIVQVQKDPLGTKGARLTRRITLPGRYVVFTPFSQHIGVSQRIDAPKERDRLKDILNTIAPDGAGFIVRTAAENLDAEALRREAYQLVQQWLTLNEQAQQVKTPILLYEDLNLLLRATRDLLSQNIERIIVDSVGAKEQIEQFIKQFVIGKTPTIELYGGTAPIFDHFDISPVLSRALERRVWLKGGGYIVIDQAEALTAIDVNSGKFVGKSNLEDTVTRVNLEAIKAIAYQLRLRNIGGIVIIDFIDMADATNRDKIVSTLTETLKADRTKTTVLGISEIGLLEMTRKRVRDSLGELLTEPCPSCNARGYIKNKHMVTGEIIRSLRSKVTQQPIGSINIEMNTQVANHLYDTCAKEIESIETSFHCQIMAVPKDTWPQERFEIITETIASTQ